jgi:hypothetical protein
VPSNVSEPNTERARGWDSTHATTPYTSAGGPSLPRPSLGNTSLIGPPRRLTMLPSSTGRKLNLVSAADAATIRERGNTTCTPCLLSGKSCERAISDYNLLSGEFDFTKTNKGNPMCRTCERYSDAPNDCDSTVTKARDTTDARVKAGIKAGSSIMEF